MAWRCPLIVSSRFDESYAHVGRRAGWTRLQDAAKAYEIDMVMGMHSDFVRLWQPCIYISMRPQYYGYPAGDDWAAEEKAAKVKVRTASRHGRPPICPLVDAPEEAGSACASMQTVA